jgi:glycosyltransferase involved in cell wall biosynthesis
MADLKPGSPDRGESELSLYVAHGILEIEGDGSRLRHLRTSITEISKARLRSIVKSREVSAVRIAPGLTDAKHVLVTTIHNEAIRIPFILSYYKAMGFQQFIIIDNRSDDGVHKILDEEAGVSVFSANGSFRHARYGYDWVNGILSKYCKDKWVLYIDADEFLVFPHCDTKGIDQLTDFMEKIGQDSLQCLMLDMYSDKKAADNIYHAGDDPLAVCRFYDRDGYKMRYNTADGTIWIKGGVRGRLYFSDDIFAGPALNKTPLVFWKRHYAFLKATHQLWPARLNGGASGLTRLRGALLHFKFLSDWTAKISNEFLRQQHTDEYASYVAAGGSAVVEPDFMGPPTAEYSSWRSLEQDGLIHRASWDG